jgi:hypothetical protein
MFGLRASRPLPKHGFVYARLIPIRPVSDAWLVSGSMRAYCKSDAAQVVQVALELATRLPELVYRNPEKIEQAWKQMQADRAAFAEFFGCDELVLPPADQGHPGSCPAAAGMRRLRGRCEQLQVEPDRLLQECTI